MAIGGGRGTESAPSSPSSSPQLCMPDELDLDSVPLDRPSLRTLCNTHTQESQHLTGCQLDGCRCRSCDCYSCCCYSCSSCYCCYCCIKLRLMILQPLLMLLLLLLLLLLSTATSATTAITATVAITTASAFAVPAAIVVDIANLLLM